MVNKEEQKDILMMNWVGFVEEREREIYQKYFLFFRHQLKFPYLDTIIQHGWQVYSSKISHTT